MQTGGSGEATVRCVAGHLVIAIAEQAGAAGRLGFFLVAADAHFFFEIKRRQNWRSAQQLARIEDQPESGT